MTPFSEELREILGELAREELVDGGSQGFKVLLECLLRAPSTHRVGFAFFLSTRFNHQLLLQEGHHGLSSKIADSS